MRCCDMRWLIVLLAVGGCHRVFSSDSPPPTDAPLDALPAGDWVAIETAHFSTCGIPRTVRCGAGGAPMSARSGSALTFTRPRHRCASARARGTRYRRSRSTSAGSSATIARCGAGEVTRRANSASASSTSFHGPSRCSSTRPDAGRQSPSEQFTRRDHRGGPQSVVLGQQQSRPGR